MDESVYRIPSPELGDVELQVAEEGTGRPVLLLHGGAGPRSMAAFARTLANTAHASVLTPTHPGFDGTRRPDRLADVPGLARLYLQLLRERRLAPALVVGNSVGGWIAAEMAVQAGSSGGEELGGMVLVDAGGLALPETPIVDVSTLTLDQLFDLSYYNPAPFRAAMAQMPDAQRRAMAANRATLQVYTGTRMSDPSLLGRLASVRTPTLVVWGAADRVIPPAHGEAFTQAIPGARSVSIATAGHMPQLETPDLLAQEIGKFADELPRRVARSG